MKERTDPPRDRDTDGRAAALAAFDRGDDGADLAGLTEQSPPRRTAARADHDPVTASLRFDHDDLALSVRVHAPARGPQAADRSVHGQITGHVDEADLRARRPGRSFGVRVGADGRFTLTGLDRGPLSLEVRRPGRAPVITAWFTV
ncbi:hypothetical protein DFP74_0334 [Nocardiopsis sp. Huas11]|uniref:carboxypeptidase-like regulatory domain-containing protein n=1 Tax=Nocardiopsis sp. Huas11 TaxID=2183912 RepID=UPI000EAB549B|nr:carboxypeptidase-like regulatory domain-containing protein [Nocardiopsis sp. Huas11]RKS04761.1 hypothetical protein DFP74_0334 [Nocardiopsis sp. Huas11]